MRRSKKEVGASSHRKHKGGGVRLSKRGRMSGVGFYKQKKQKQTRFSKKKSEGVACLVGKKRKGQPIEGVVLSQERLPP